MTSKIQSFGLAAFFLAMLGGSVQTVLADQCGKTHSLSGKVIKIDEQGRKRGMPEVELVLSGDASGSTNTTRSGSYRFRNLPDGNYEVTPHVEGCVFNPSSHMVTVAGRHIRKLNFTASCGSVAFKAVSRGALAAEWFGQYGVAKFFKDGAAFYSKIGGGGGGRGFNVAALDPNTGELLQEPQNFDTWINGCSAMQDMLSYLDSVPNGALLIIAVADEAGINQWDSCGPRSLPCLETFLQGIQTLGSTKIRSYCYRDSYVLLSSKNEGVVGEQLGTAVEVSVQTKFTLPNP